MPAATSVTVDALLSAIAAAGVLSADELEAAKGTFPDGVWPADATKLIEGLYRVGKLTRFQGQMLLAGRGSSLIIGDYLLLDKLGAGGMGQVFKARHRRMKREIALKVLPAAVQKDAALIARFQREVEAAAKLTHPNVVVAYDAGVDRGVHYLVTEYVAGCDLGAFVKDKGPLPPAWAVEFLYQAALGLDYAHRQGVIHRDIKPSNFLVSREGAVKVADLGLARVLAPEESIAQKDADGLTNTGAVMGTVDYMAPEQAMDTHLADVRSDIYSLGCTLHFLLTGRAPFPSGTVVQKILAHREQPPPLLQASATGADADAVLVAALNDVFQRMVAKRPEARFASMGDVIATLQPLRQKLSIEELNQRGSGLKMTAVATSLPRTDPVTNAYNPTMGPGGGLDVTNPLPTIMVGDSMLAMHKHLATKPKPSGWGFPVFAGGVVAAVGVLALVFLLVMPNPPSEPVTPNELTTSATGPAKPTDGKPAKPLRVSALAPDMILNPASIPREELLDEHPNELVAVIGSSARRHWSFINDLVYDDAGTRLYSVSSDGTVVAWDARDMKRLSRLTFVNRRDGEPDQRMGAYSAVWDAIRQCLWVGVYNGTVNLVEFRDGKLIEAEQWNAGEPGTYVQDLRVSPNGQWLAAIDTQLYITLWDLEATPPRLAARVRLPNTAQGQAKICFSLDGSRLVATSDRELRIFDLSALKTRELPNDWEPPVLANQFPNPTPNPFPRVLSYSPTGNWLATDADNGEWRLKLWHQDDTGHWSPKHDLPGVGTAAFSPDGRWLAAGMYTGVRLYDLRKENWEQSPVTLSNRLRMNAWDVAFRPDSQRVVVGDEAGRIYEWDITSAIPRELSNHESIALPGDLQWSPDGRHLVVASIDSGVAWWSLKDRQFSLRKTWATSQYPRGVSWGADSQWVAFGDGWASPHLNVVLSADLGRTEVSIPGGIGHGWSSVAMSPDGLRLAQSGVDGEIHLWNRDSPQSGWALQPSIKLAWQVVSMTFAPDSQRLAVAVANPLDPAKTPPIAWLYIIEFGAGKLWVREELPLTAGGGAGQTVVWSPDGKKLFAYGNDTSGNPPLRVYNVASDPPRYLFGAHISATGLSVSPDGKHIATASGDTVNIVSSDPLYPAHTYRLAGTVNDVDWHPSGEYLATSNANGTVYILKVPETLLSE